MRGPFLALLLSGCSARVAEAPGPGCDDAAAIIVDSAAIIVDSATAVADDAPDSAQPAPTADSGEHESRCRSEIEPSGLLAACGQRCQVAIALDYDTLALQSWAITCGLARAKPVRAADAPAIVRAELGVGAPSATLMTGMEHAVWQTPSGETAGTLAVVDAQTGLTTFAASVTSSTTAGGITLHPYRWQQRPAPALDCAFTPTSVPAGVAVYPSEGPAFGAFQANEVATAAWRNVVGWGIEKHVRTAPTTAYVLRYAPTYKGTFRDWIVVVPLRDVCCSRHC